jgi:hypothetical protein
MRTLLRAVTFVVVSLGLAAGASAFAMWTQAPPSGQDKEKAAADPISGDWEGVVELPDGAIPFTMKLKVDQGKVTGEVASTQGTAPISEGSWVDGKLSLAFTYVDGAAVVMTGGVTNGLLGGSLSYGGGQLVVTWSAKKKADK